MYYMSLKLNDMIVRLLLNEDEGFDGWDTTPGYVLNIVTQFVFTIYLYIRVGFHSQANRKVVDKLTSEVLSLHSSFDASTVRGMSFLIATGSINFFSSCCLSIF